MPLVRVEVRNEYALGAPELYNEANKEDPKAVLEGVAVAGLVGILRQLGDLAEFAAEVFHGLQEQVMITSSRSHKLMGRVQRIEAALPRLEKLVLAQRSHLHFAYTSGANWHSHLRCEQSHFIYSDLPRFIMDSYEHCQGPPHLNLLDKFDPGGPGSCLKRYSDPSFFKRASSGSDGAYVNKILKEKRGRKIKKKRSSQKTGEFSHGASFSNTSSRTHFASLDTDGRISPCQTFSTYDAPKSDLGDQSMSLGSRYWSDDLEHVSHPNYSMPHKEQEYKESCSSPARMNHNDSNNNGFLDRKDAVIDDTRSSLPGEQTGPSSFCVTWDEKMEILEPVDRAYDHDESVGRISMISDLGTMESGVINFETAREYDNDENLERYSTNFDGETEERVANHLKTAQEYEYDCTLETHPTNSDPGTEQRGTSNYTAAKGYDHDENLEMLSTHSDGETEQREASHLKTTEEYDYDSNSETQPTNFDLVTEGGTSHLRAAKGYDCDETLETLDMNSDLETGDREAIHFNSSGQMDVRHNEKLSIPISGDIQPGDSESEAICQMNSQLQNEDMLILTCGGVQHDDVESETDNYVDALNTIESEYETDVDVPAKQEVEQHSVLDDKAIDAGVDKLTTMHSGIHSLNSKSQITTSISLNNCTLGIDPQPLLPETRSGDRVASEDIHNSVSLESCAHVQSPQLASKSLNSVSTLDVDSGEIGDTLGSSNVSSVISCISSDSIQQNFGVAISDKMTNNLSELQEPSPEPSSVSSVKFWTNGGLLGLQPSKPPECCMLNVSSGVMKTKDDTVSTSTLKSDITDKRSISIDEDAIPECSTSCQDDKRGSIFIKKASRLFSSADLGANLEKLSDSCNKSYIDSSQHNGDIDTCWTVQPVSLHVRSTRASEEKSSNSSQIFELGNRLLMNGFHRKQSFDKDDNSNSISSPNPVLFELKNGHESVDNQMFSGRSKKEMLRSWSPIVSPSTSPPLGHMKISFPPINGFEAHKLELKFPGGNVSHESGRDMLPSFQLVPESTIPLHGAASDSEDDTFCRSSPSGSDCRSHQSDSNSEQWESSESPTSKDHELYDALQRISFTEPVPTPRDTGAAFQGELNNNYRTQFALARDSVRHSESGQLFDLPSLDTMHPSFMENNNCDLSNLSEPQCPVEPSPSPPPLPPPQWRAIKPEAELADDPQIVISENLKHSFDHRFGSIISHQPKPAPLKQEQIIEAAHTLKSKYMQQQDLEKTTGQKKVNQAVCQKETEKKVNKAAGQKETEEKEDFLHQIRSKSFSLRRTVTAKPTVTPILPTSVQVTAILKKAHEIRQAVGSDGEDDNWSDT